jgi:hypothetical protein
VDGSRELPPAKGVATIFSCSANEVALELDELRHGLFFYHVLEGLRGKAANAKGKITFNLLADYVSDAVSTRNTDQNPHQKSNLTGGSPVFATVVPVPSAPTADVEKPAKEKRIPIPKDKLIPIPSVDKPLTEPEPTADIEKTAKEKFLLIYYDPFIKKPLR